MIGIIPAAGRSTRIGGGPKPLLATGDGTFLERAIRALQAAEPDSIHVGVRHDPGPVAAAARRAGARTHIPEEVDDGPIATIRTVLRTLRDEGTPPNAILLLPVDFPLLQPETVAALSRKWRESDAHLVLPRMKGRTGHPALLGGPLLDELLEPDLSEGAKSVVKRHADAAIHLEVDDRGILIDIDTLPEYRRHFPQAYRKRFQKW